MQFFATVLAFSAVAFALPGGSTKTNNLTLQQAAEQCNGSGQEVSCCNTGGSSSGASSGKGGLVGSVLNGNLNNVLAGADIVGGECSQIFIPVSILSKGVNNAQASSHCNNQVACCPTGTKSGSAGCVAA